MKKEPKRRAVFFDRDGVILKPMVMDGKPRPPHSVAEYKALSGILPGAKEAVEKVRVLGFLAILASNQPDIAYGVISKNEWQWIQGQIKDIPFDDVFICFHRRDDGCDCKKPKPGLLFEAAKKWNIDLTKSFMVGDTDRDVGAAKAANCKTILLHNSYNKGIAADVRITHLSRIPSLFLNEANGTPKS